jgi:hypothetical protein
MYRQLRLVADEKLVLLEAISTMLFGIHLLPPQIGAEGITDAGPATSQIDPEGSFGKALTISLFA